MYLIFLPKNNIGTYGICYSSYFITVARDIPLSLKLYVIIHELVHYFCGRFHLHYHVAYKIQILNEKYVKFILNIFGFELLLDFSRLKIFFTEIVSQYYKRQFLFEKR